MEGTIPRIELQTGYSISRIIKGGWQLAGGHGPVDRAQAIRDMEAFVSAGITTFDCADIYTGVEELIGEFIRRSKSAFVSGSLPRVQIHTKYVPDLDDLPHLGRADVEAIIDRSLKRLGVERLDLVQLHWWDYSIQGYVETALHLRQLQQQGKIRHIGVTNFDGAHLQVFCHWPRGVDFISSATVPSPAVF
jgi:aryl-alcohol dehydrogenase-like predicted oxidoreductase